jgi:hypothetical protein
MSSKRTFITSLPHRKSVSSSVFHSSSPVGSAKKAFNQICHSDKPCKEIVVVEDPEKNKKYAYEVSRKSINKDVMLGDTKVHFSFESKAKSIGLDEVAKKRKKIALRKKFNKCVKKCKKAVYGNN